MLQIRLVGWIVLCWVCRLVCLFCALVLVCLGFVCFICLFDSCILVCWWLFIWYVLFVVCWLTLILCLVLIDCDFWGVWRNIFCLIYCLGFWCILCLRIIWQRIVILGLLAINFYSICFGSLISWIVFLIRIFYYGSKTDFTRFILLYRISYPNFFAYANV